MPLSAALIAYFVGARPAVSTDNAADAPAVKHSGSSESGPVVSVGESRAPCGAERPGPPKKRRRRGPCDLEKILKDAHDRRPEDKGACCKKQCDRKFADETNKDYRADWLAAEHSRFHSLESEPDRKAFVLNRLPFVEKDRRHLRAASKIVCGNFFKQVFGVSNNVIYAAKGTPGARASSCVDKRCANVICHRCLY